MTKQKLLILDIINKAQTHYTAEQIFAQAQKIMPSMVRATVYNNLKALLKENHIRKIILSNQADCYDKVLPEHDHLICAKCGRISDIVVGGIKEKIKSQLDCDFLSYSLNINYICKNCKNQEGTENDQ